MKVYKSNEELLDYIISKGVIVNDRQDAINKFQRYTYYSIINTYKEVFKKDKKILKLLKLTNARLFFEFWYVFVSVFNKRPCSF